MTGLSEINFKELPDGISFKVLVQPRASRNVVYGVVQDSIKLCLTSPPVEGEANERCVAFVADIFGVAKRNVSLVSGHKNRNKVIKVTGIDKMKFFATLEKVLKL